MSAIIPTRDSQSRTTLKTAAGNANLPSHQAKDIFVPTYEITRNFSANSLGSFSTYSEFVLDPSQLPDILDKVTLVLTFPAATMTGGTVISLVNDGAFLSRLIEVSIGSEVVSSIYPEHGYTQGVLHLTNESKFKVMGAAGNKLVATRRTNCAAGQTLYIPVSIPWLQKFGWFSKAHAAQIRIKIYHAALSDVIQTDGTVPVLSISSVGLNLGGRQYINQASVSAIVGMQQKLTKFDERFLDVIQQQTTLISGSSSYSVQLTNLVGNFDHVLFVVRAASSVGTALANAPDAFVAVSSYNFKNSSGDIIVPETNSAYALGPLMDKYILGDATDVASGLATTQKYIYPLFFGSRPEEALRKGTFHGSYKMTGLDKLTLTFGSALGANYVVDVIGYVWSNLSVDSAGHVKKSLVV